MSRLEGELLGIMFDMRVERPAGSYVELVRCMHASYQVVWPAVEELDMDAVHVASLVV